MKKKEFKEGDIIIIENYMNLNNPYYVHVVLSSDEFYTKSICCRRSDALPNTREQSLVKYIVKTQEFHRIKLNRNSVLIDSKES